MKKMFIHWFDAFKKVKMENKIDMKNIYNMNEIDIALDIIQVSRVIINKNIDS